MYHFLIRIQDKWFVYCLGTVVDLFFISGMGKNERRIYHGNYKDQ